MISLQGKTYALSVYIAIPASELILTTEKSHTVVLLSNMTGFIPAACL
jgi:hypothetical protein